MALEVEASAAAAAGLVLEGLGFLFCLLLLVFFFLGVLGWEGALEGTGDLRLPALRVGGW